MTAFITIRIFRRNIETKYSKPDIRYKVIGLIVFRLNLIAALENKSVNDEPTAIRKPVDLDFTKIPVTSISLYFTKMCQVPA